jgi:hypothetical protein
MYKLKLVLLAVFFFIGYVFALSQGEVEDRQAAINAWAEREARAAEEAAEARGGMHSRSPCVVASRPTAAPAAPSATQRPPAQSTSRPAVPTVAPTQRATPAPTVAPTQRATPAPTSAPTVAPTQKATSAATTRPTVGLCDIVPTSQEPLKLLVPLYVYPGAAWDQVMSAASKVGTIAIVNPYNGPLAKGPDSAYKTYMQRMVAAGVEQVGYVYTSWGARNINDVKADIDLYASMYPGITGIFFDEASSSASDIPFYREAYNHVIRKGWKNSILNPGVAPAPGYLDISSNIVIFENYGTEVNKNYASYVKCAPNASQKAGWKYKFSGIAHSATVSQQTNLMSTMASQGMGLVYVTDGAGGCCTYNQLTTYMSAQATSLASLN